MLSRRSFLKGSLYSSALMLAAPILPALAQTPSPDPSYWGKRRFAPVNVSPDRIIRTTVGLRPFRDPGYLVKAEKLGRKLLVHNYGHGGGGISLSWGTAAEALELARDYVAMHPRRAGELAALSQIAVVDLWLRERNLPGESESGSAAVRRQQPALGGRSRLRPDDRRARRHQSGAGADRRPAADDGRAGLSRAALLPSGPEPGGRQPARHGNRDSGVHLLESGTRQRAQHRVRLFRRRLYVAGTRDRSGRGPGGPIWSTANLGPAPNAR